MNSRTKLGLLAGLAILLAAGYIFTQTGGNWGYILPKRSLKVAAMVLTGGAIAVSTVIFQTLSQNRILTPNIIGLDSLYMLIQTLVVSGYGSSAITVFRENLNFLITVLAMLLFGGLLYSFLFRREGRNLYFLLLVGLILGTLFGSLTTFMQVLMDPNEFMRVQDRMFASFNNIHDKLLALSIILIGITAVFGSGQIKFLDVLALGRDHALNLGIHYEAAVKRLLMIVIALVSVSTALAGPVTFLGLLVANVAYHVLGTYRHRELLAGSVLIGIIALVGGQWLVERVFTFSTTLSVIINFAGGIYFFHLLLKENRT